MKLQVHDNDTQDQQRQPTLAQIFLAGAGCGLASTYVHSFLPLFRLKKKMIDSPLPHRLLTTPIELIKIQQQKHQQLLHTTHEVGGRRNTSPTSASASASARAVALHIYRTGGIRALYRGLSATIWRDVGGYGLYFYGVRTSRASPPLPHPICLSPHANKIKIKTLTVRRHAAPLRRASRLKCGRHGHGHGHDFAQPPSPLVGSTTRRGCGGRYNRLDRDVPF
jgi:hypothetical protein